MILVKANIVFDNIKDQASTQSAFTPVGKDHRTPLD